MILGEIKRVLESLGALCRRAANELEALVESIMDEPTPEPAPNRESFRPTIEDVFRGVGSKHGIPWQILAGIARVESNFDPLARGAAKEIGMMQLMPHIARTLLNRRGITAPGQNVVTMLLKDVYLQVDLAADLIDELRVNVGGPKSNLIEEDLWEDVLQAYNVGEPAFKRGRGLASYSRNVFAWIERDERPPTVFA